MSKPAIPETEAIPLSQVLGIIVNGLCKAMQKQSETDPHIVLICVRLWTRLIHLTKRYEHLVKRFLDGRLGPYQPRPYRPRTKWPEPVRKPGEEPKPKQTLPCAFGWILKYVPAAADSRDQLRDILADPVMIEFLTAVPQAGRLLRPLCRTLGVPLTAELLPRKKPEPATTPTGDAPPADPQQPARAKKPDPCASETHAGDPLWARPVSLWSDPPRKRPPAIRT